MSDELYRDIIIEHSQHPRCHGQLEQPSHRGHGDNPLCGDKIDVELSVDAEGVIAEVAIRAVGCAISTASTSLLAAAIKGRDIDQARRLFAAVHAMLTGAAQPEPQPELGELVALSMVKRYPMRVKCATLPWHTLRQALDGEPESATTE